MAESVDMTPHRPVSVKLTVIDWIKFVSIIVSLIIAQTSAVVWYMARFEARIDEAQSTANEAMNEARATAERLAGVKDTWNSALVKIASDIGEIKGQLGQLSRENR
jgi:hypothetical protein